MRHEFRTPLNAIIGFSDLVLSEPFGPLDSERYRSYLRDVMNSGEHLLSLINDLLGLTGTEARHRTTPSGFDLGGPAHGSPNRRKGGYSRLRGAASPDLPRAMVDARSMHQCLLNLLPNAIRANRRSGHVAVWVDRPTAKFVRFSVIDTGKGMSRALLERLVKTSGPVGANYVAEIVGAGLGLPITKSIANIMGGRLEIESNRVQGTAVSLMIPIA